tara:strand:- start:719 stop:1168 length:450 start_codon:yes stop_codon:yes gene_type:complete
MDDLIVKFIYKDKQEYVDKKNKFLLHLKNSMTINDDIYKSIIYSGIYNYYKIFSINKIICTGLNELTNYEQPQWVEKICWHIFKCLNTCIDSLPFHVLKSFKNKELEELMYKNIYISLVGADTLGFLNFIEEKNIYMEEEPDLLDLFLQ